MGRLVVEGQRGEQRQIAVRVVVPVEERELLLPVRGIVGVIQIDGDAAGAAPEPAALACDHDVGERGRQPEQLAAPDGVLEAR